MLTDIEIRQIIEAAVAPMPMVERVVLASALHTGYVELLVVLSDGAAARRLLVHVSRATRAEFERSFRDGLRRAGADL